MTTYSTRDAARLVGVMVATLLRWVKRGYVKPSMVMPLGSAGREIWRWTEADIAKVKRYKKANYQKGVGRPRSAREK
jgi:predicted site-specific integrase-resolvase